MNKYEIFKGGIYSQIYFFVILFSSCYIRYIISFLECRFLDDLIRSVYLFSLEIKIKFIVPNINEIFIFYMILYILL